MKAISTFEIHFDIPDDKMALVREQLAAHDYADITSDKDVIHGLAWAYLYGDFTELVTKFQQSARLYNDNEHE